MPVIDTPNGKKVPWNMHDFVGKVGVIGGGQLGRMLIQALQRLDADVYLYAESRNSPASKVLCVDSDPKMYRIELGLPFRSTQVRAFAESMDRVTVEIENVEGYDATDATKLVPRAQALADIRCKLTQKRVLESRGIPVARAIELDRSGGIHKQLQRVVESGMVTLPCMLKLSVGAYDGRGNWRIDTVDDSAGDGQAARELRAVFDQADEARKRAGLDAKLYVEEWVDYNCEFAVMVVIDEAGNAKTYPVVETIHTDSILEAVIVPASVSPALNNDAQRLAIAAARCFQSPGVFGVEMFCVAGELLVNEIAPRPHNSGHYTMDACAVSQFDQLARILVGLPIGDTALKVPCAVMINELGDKRLWRHRAFATPGATVHLYGKDECRPQRKMGHINVTGDSWGELLERVSGIVRGDIPTLLERISNRVQPESSPNVPLPLKASAVVGIIMGSDSDYPTMAPGIELLRKFQVPFEVALVSAHRTPDRLVAYARQARSRGLRVIIAGAGGAAHLPGMVAAMTTLPVIGCPVALKQLDGMDSLLSIVQMPRGVPVATVAINNATNAALLALRMLGMGDARIAEALAQHCEAEAAAVLVKHERLDVPELAVFPPVGQQLRDGVQVSEFFGLKGAVVSAQKEPLF